MRGIFITHTTPALVFICIFEMSCANIIPNLNNGHTYTIFHICIRNQARVDSDEKIAEFNRFSGEKEHDGNLESRMQIRKFTLPRF